MTKLANLVIFSGALVFLGSWFDPKSVLIALFVIMIFAKLFQIYFMLVKKVSNDDDDDDDADEYSDDDDVDDEDDDDVVTSELESETENEKKDMTFVGLNRSVSVPASGKNKIKTKDCFF